MAASDRTQYKQVVMGSLGDSRTITNAQLVVAQEAQRFAQVCLSTGTAANAAGNYSIGRVDRAVQIKEVRVCPSAAVTVNGNTVFNYGWTNDGGGALTVMGTINTNQNANLGTGNLAQWQSVVVTANLAVNQVVPAGSQIVFQQVPTAPSEALPAGTSFQVLWEEV